jgi:AraC family transcriptional activator of mtrCDE
MSDERLMPAVFAVLETPEQPLDAGEYGRPRFFVARHLRPAFCPRHLTPQAWPQLRMAMAARLLRVERQTNLEVIAGR